jgi:nicotinamidase-related amidase
MPGLGSNSRKKRVALLVVDMTNDFLLKKFNPNLALEKGLVLIPRIKTLEEAFLKSGQSVIFATDRHLKSDYELKKWGPHSMKGTEGSKIVEGLVTKEIEVLKRKWKAADVALAVRKKMKKKELLFEVEKGTYSAFTDNGGRSTAMDSLLKKLGFRAGDKLYITGLHTNCCDKHTAADAWFRGYVPVMVTDCCSAFDDPEGKMGMSHDNALNYENYWYNAELKSSQLVMRELTQP